MLAETIAPSFGELSIATPVAWFDAACERWRELLVDHANCEKKAASTALSFIFSYAPDAELTERLSRLAREELRHFEQVQKLMRELHVPWAKLSPSRYAEGLRRAVSTSEPQRQLDLMVIGAFIEARSCERFVGLAPRLPAPMGTFYGGLAASEARHNALYRRLAERHALAHGLDAGATFARFAAIEADLVTSPDPQFRFHSGLPV
jgi:tRNA 2-(methylsulfanyl)-N6-isopentenyladenosine37 hydroxylase